MLLMSGQLGSMFFTLENELCILEGVFVGTLNVFVRPTVNNSYLLHLWMIRHNLSISKSLKAI